jgi:hypothetical protein
MYFRKVGLEIFRYSIASSVVKTISFSVKDTEFPPFILILLHFLAKYMPREAMTSFSSIRH